MMVHKAECGTAAGFGVCEITSCYGVHIITDGFLTVPKLGTYFLLYNRIYFNFFTRNAWNIKQMLKTQNWSLITIKQLPVFCNVTLCHRVSSSQCFRWTCYHSSWTLDPWIWRRHVPSKHQEPFMQNHCVTSQETGVLESNTISPERWRHFDPSKQQELITQYHSITSQEDFILKSHMNHCLCNCFNHFSANNLYALLQILNQAGMNWHFIFRVLGSNRSSKTTYHDRMFCISQDNALGTRQMMVVS
jgi:hypothetical protein